MEDVWSVLKGAVWWHPAALAGLAMVTRALPRMFCPEARGSDAFYHLLAARRIRENRFRLPRTFHECRLPGIYDYPPLYHYLIALFPRSWHPEVERWSSAVIDALHGTVFYLMCFFCLSRWGGVADAAPPALWAGLLFLLSPSLTSVGAGPRAYQGTPRTLGELLFMLSLSCSLLYTLHSDIWLFVGGAVSGALLLLTSKFGVQVFVFFHAVFLIGFREPVWIAVPAGAALLALLLSLGHYREVLTGHWDHCRYYRSAISARFYMVTRKNRWEDVRRLGKNLLRDPARAARTVLMDNTYLLLILKHPQLLYVLAIAATRPVTEGPLYALCLLWIGAGLAAFLLTSLKPLLFLGEADRYLEYALFPQFLLLALSDRLFPFAFFLAGYEAILYVVFAGIFIRQYSRKARELPAFRDMAAFIASDDRVRAVLPLYLENGLQLALESGKGVAHFPANFRNRYFPYGEFLSFYEKVFPFPSENLVPLMRRYGFDTVYFSETDLQKARENGLRYAFEGWVVLFSQAGYTVLQPGNGRGTEDSGGG